MKPDDSNLAPPLAPFGGESGGARRALARLRSATPGSSRQWLAKLGLPGVMAIGLLTACAAFLGSVVLPMNQQIDELRRSVQTLSERSEQFNLGARQGNLPVGEQLAEFYRLFPSQGELTDKVAQVFDLARAQGLELPQGDYRVAEDRVGRLRRYQMQFPVKADYPRIRRFLAGVAAEIPGSALEHIEFGRQKIGEPQVEATIKLDIFLGQGS